MIHIFYNLSQTVILNHTELYAQIVLTETGKKAFMFSAPATSGLQKEIKLMNLISLVEAKTIVNSMINDSILNFALF